MTREELEEGKRLLGELDGSAHFDGPTSEACKAKERLAADWLLANSDELLFLAEEARWRRSSEEPPEGNVYVVALHENGLITDRFFYDGKWSVHGGKPTHWRPLPRGPVKP